MSENQKERPKRKRDGVFQRDGRWWIRWTCSLGHDHRNPIGDTKGRALDEYHKRRALVRRAREDGAETFAPACNRSGNVRPLSGSC